MTLKDIKAVLKVGKVTKWIEAGTDVLAILKEANDNADKATAHGSTMVQKYITQ